ncbi:MAG: alpha/beta hydrolase [Planctomycetota bacterium]|nr:MAG: alpha/beta hydrolase [Planctomycetota bacterium]
MQQTETRFTQKTIEIPVTGIQLKAQLTIPGLARGVVVFAHGFGSTCFSRRNQLVAAKLQNEGIGTLLLDLLAPGEKYDPEMTGDIDLLARRLAGVTEWLMVTHQTADFPIGLFGSGTGSAAALEVAASMPDVIHAVVSRGGRPDLADSWLPLVEAPTLLLVGNLDNQVMELNRRAMRCMDCTCELVSVAGATHRFPEQGTMDQVAVMARDWFVKYLNGKEDWQ